MTRDNNAPPCHTAGNRPNKCAQALCISPRSKESARLAVRGMDGGSLAANLSAPKATELASTDCAACYGPKPPVQPSTEQKRVRQ